MKTLKLFISTLSITSLLLIGCCGNNSKKESNQVESSNTNEQVQRPTKAEQLISDQRPRFKVIKSTIVEYLDKEITVYGFCTMSDYYNGLGYRDASSTHYCTSIMDNKGESFHVYFEKSKNKDLFNLLSEKDRVPLELRIICLSSKYMSEAGTQFEGFSWKMITN